MRAAVKVRPLLRRAFYEAGLYGAWLRTVGADTLTVALFHRVLPDGHPGWRDAHPDFTIADSLLQQCLAFFATHYNLVGLAEVIENRDDGRPLPPRALLVTFDDGWADTVEFALPVIRRFDVRPVVFVVADAIVGGEDTWWQHVVDLGLRTGQADRLRRCLDAQVGDAACAADGDDAAWDLILRLGSLAPAARSSVLAAFAGSHEVQEAPRQMMTADQVRALCRADCAVASHGFSHMPLTMLSDVSLARELAMSRAVLDDLVGSDDPASRTSMSVPHGRCDDRVIAAAGRAGYTTVFTSHAVVNRMNHGRIPDLLGRININGRAITDANGQLVPDKLARLLFARVLNWPVPGRHVRRQPATHRLA